MGGTGQRCEGKFAFYLIFPFYCVLIKTRKRAWCTFAISLMLNYVCGSYFGLGRTNIIYSLCYFVAGGLVYQHRDELEIFSRKYQWISLGTAAASVILYFFIGGNTITMLLVSVSFLVYALGRNRGGIGESVHQIRQLHQYGDLPLPYGIVSCD